jgi:hypothetical protein
MRRFTAFAITVVAIFALAIAGTASYPWNLPLP